MRVAPAVLVFLHGGSSSCHAWHVRKTIPLLLMHERTDPLVRLQRSAFAGTLAAGAGFAYYKNADTDTQFMLASASGPIVRLFDVETSHNLGIAAAAFGLFPRDPRPDPAILATKVWGLKFSNPIGKCKWLSPCPDDRKHRPATTFRKTAGGGGRLGALLCTRAKMKAPEPAAPGQVDA